MSAGSTTFKNKLRIPRNFNKKIAIIFASIFAVIGIAMLVRSFAATAISIDSTLPVPTNVKAYPDDQNIVVTWDKVSDSRVVGYYLTYRVAGSSSEFTVRQSIHDQIQLQPLANGTEYEIYVQSVSGYITTTEVGPLVYGGGLNHWRRGDGKVSNKTAVTKATTSSARVDAMRSRLTGFFDDFNSPAGPMDERKWNQATSACVAPNTAAAFVNPQFHGHNMVRSACDRSGMATRPRAVFDTTGATETNPAQIEFDMDGATHGRDIWYLDIIPMSARTNGYPLDITSHNDLFDMDHEDPGKMVRIGQTHGSGPAVDYYNTVRNENLVDWSGQNKLPLSGGEGCPTWTNDLQWCDFTKKTGTFSQLPQSAKAEIIPNVRKHWVVQITPTKLKIFIDGTFMGAANLPTEFSAEKKFTLHSTIFSYATGKMTDTEGDRQITPYVQLFHWDNFGFTGPKPTQIINNYLEGGATGKTPVYSTGSSVYKIPGGNRTTIIPIPDQIGNLVNNKAGLYFTMNQFGFNSYTWAPGDHIIFNGTRYEVPNPSTLLVNPKTLGACSEFSATYVGTALTVPINKSDIRQGDNTVTFNLKGQGNGCNGAQADVLNVHLELPYASTDTSIPAYSQPIKVFGESFRAVAEPQITNCDQYRYIEQDLGLPYQTGKANLAIGPCALVQGHATSTPGTTPTTPPPPPANQLPASTLTTSTTSGTAPASYNLTATASDPDGTIAKIEIRLGSTILRTCTSSPCTFSATNIAAGTYTYSSVATDNVGGSTTSQNTTVTVTAPTPTPPTSSKFTTLAVNAPLPSDSECSARVRPVAEIRPLNQVPNNTRGIGGNYETARVSGNYVGTTDEIIQWAACKWGMDEDVLRAQMVQESYWHQSAIGDFTSGGQTLCSPVYPVANYASQYNGDPTHTNQCPESYGLSQVRWTYHKTAFYSSPTESTTTLTNNAIYSTAYNADYYGSIWRRCFNGDFGWLNTVERGQDYAAGDQWGCLGMWFSGRWYTDPAKSYISAVQNNLNTKVWETTAFKNAPPSNTVPGQVPQDSTPPTVSFTAPANNATVAGTVAIRTNATDNVGVSRVSYYLDNATSPFSTDLSSPYESSWNSATVSNGSHAVKAVAIDAIGNTTTATLTLNVQNTLPDTTAPVTSITSPTNNKIVMNTITITANATDNVGVSKVQLLIDGNVVATDLTSPYSFVLDTAMLSDDNHTLRTNAFDAKDNIGLSSIVTIIVDNIPTPPLVCEDPAANNQGQVLPCTYTQTNPDPTPTPGDVDGDNDVDREDIRIVRYYYNKTVLIYTNGDLDGDGYVGREDLRIVRYYYRGGQ